MASSLQILFIIKEPALKSTVLVVVILLSPFLFAMDKFQTADIGFNGVGQYIAIELLVEDGQEAYKFFLQDSRNNLAVEVSQCTFLHNTLVTEVNHIVDSSVKADFEWIFFKSGKSSVLIENFSMNFGNC